MTRPAPPHALCSVASWHALTRHAAHLAPGWLALGLALLAGCGESAPSGRFGVVQREFAWTRAHDGPPPPPLGMSFEFEHDAQGWRLADGRVPDAGDGRLTARGLDQLAFRSPDDLRFEPDVHHWLSFRARTSAVESVRVRWRAEGEAFSAGRSTTAQPVEGDGGFTTFTIPVDSLRGLLQEGDAAEGLAQLELLFEGLPGSRPEVQLDAVHLASEFDRADDAPRRLGRQGVYRTGTTLRAPGRLECALAPGPHDRLRLALALAGGDAPCAVTLTLVGSGAPPTTVTLQPGAPWHELDLDLSLAGGARTSLAIALTEGDGLLMVGGVLRLARDASARPDVVLYLEDTLRADRLGAYGYPYPTDPFLSRMAAEGTLFEHAYGGSNWTRPSVSTLLTSLDPVAHGNITHLDRVAAQATTLAEALAAQGYQTRSYVTNYHGGAWSGLDQGFDVAAEPPAWGASRVASTLTSPVVGAPLAQVLADCADERLFVYVHSLDPHRPYQPPMEQLYPLLETAGTRPPVPGGEVHADESLRYDAEVRHNDNQLARLDEALVSSGRAEHTLLTFVSDHGEGFGEHGTFEHRESLFDEEVHVPLVMRWPGHLPAGRRMPQPVGLADVAPTLLGLLGLPSPDTWRGRDLSAVALGEGPAARIEDRVLLHTEYAQPKDGLLQEVALVDGRFKLVAGIDAAGVLVPRALFDRSDDPGELHDRLHDPALASTVAAMTAWIAARLEQSRAAALSGAATEMDPAQKQWMIEMGYLGR